MPVYDHAYKTWEGRRLGPLFRWLAIPKFAYLEFFGRRAFISILTLAVVHFVLRMGYMYILVNVDFLEALKFNPAQLIPVDAFFFKNFVDAQLALCFAFTFLMGSGLIARDLQHRAIVLYLTKPISRWEYLLGKFSVIFIASMAMTWFMATALFVFQAAVSHPSSEWRIYLWSRYIPMYASITIYCLVASSVLSLLMLAASSLTKNARNAGIGCVMFILGGTVLSRIFFESELGVPTSFSILLATWELGSHLIGLHTGRLFSMTEAWVGVLANLALFTIVVTWSLNRASRTGA